jgi:glutamate dehydrogenase
MSVQPQPRRPHQVAEFIERLLGESTGRLPEEEARLAESFLRRYYNRVSPEDLAEREMIDLHGAAMAHWQLARRRLPGQSLVRVYNPDFEKHGWESTHTVVETVMEDRPFLVDSVSIALNRHGLTIHLIVHPVMWLGRDGEGRLTTITDGSEGGATAESLMRFEVDRQSDPAAMAALAAEVERVLGDVRRSTADWQTMRGRVLGLVDGLRSAPSSVPAEDVDEAQSFLRWVEDHHFTLLGYCEYSLGGDGRLAFDQGSGLGLFRDAGEGTDFPPADTIPVVAPQYVDRSQILVVAKSNRRATVHRRAHMDFIGVRRYNERGEVDGECCILGLFASVAYSRNPREIPYLRHKIARVIEASGLSPVSHEGKALQNVLDTYPRDALFQISEALLLDTAMGILDLQERQRIRLFVRGDDYGRYYSCMLFVPRERWGRELRLRVQEILLDAFNGTELELNAQFGESILARVHVVVQVRSGAHPAPDIREIERRIIEAARSWQDDVRAELIEKYGEPRGNALFQRYGEGFSGAYADDFSARTAAYDVQHMEAVREGRALGMSVYRPVEEPAGTVRLKLFSARQAIPPSDALPLIENMGLRVMGERPYEARARDGDAIWIHEFNLVQFQGREIEPEADGDRFLHALDRVWAGELENDRFNQLVLGAGLDWREVVMFRAYSRYLRQIRIQFSEAYIIDSLARHPGVVRLLTDLFIARFDPAVSGRDARIESLGNRVESELDAVANLDEDRILRSFLNVIQATIRTNYFQRAADGSAKAYLSFKFDPAKIARMPSPRPMYEIFVYSPRTEAVHLRGGKVARGGLRWSDRREDFRTEVLGLMKAQQVKNTLIVPMGAKGGFVVKQPPPNATREAMMAEVENCYKDFIRGLLDITDNLRDGEVVPPKQCVRHDDDDPYLVVAADKGTATFSDLANAVSAEYDFWLGDAFASGGSVGYDHKKMGITAKGAWESVKRHFRELGIDCQQQPFSVAGIGDMAGDVFGNGMLLSPAIQLKAAFNHMHIFLDPDPDPTKSFARADRVCAGRRQGIHRCHRQLGRG